MIIVIRGNNDSRRVRRALTTLQARPTPAPYPFVGKWHTVRDSSLVPETQLQLYGFVFDTSSTTTATLIFKSDFTGTYAKSTKINSPSDVEQVIKIYDREGMKELASLFRKSRVDKNETLNFVWRAEDEDGEKTVVCSGYIIPNEVKYHYKKNDVIEHSWFRDDKRAKELSEKWLRETGENLADASANSDWYFERVQ